MPRLTWENVANPNFSGVSDSYRVMSELLGKATQSGQGVIDTFTKSRSDAADKAILQRQLQARTSADFNTDTILGDDAANASIAALKGVGEWGGTLLNRDTTRMNNEQMGKNNTYLNTGRDQMTAHAAAINAGIANAAQGNNSALRDQSLMGLRPDLYGAVIGDANTLLTSDLNRDSTTQRMNIEKYGQSRTERADKISDAAIVALDDVQANSFDPASAEAYALSRTDWSPEVRSQVLGRIGSGNQPTGVPGVGGASAAIGAAVGNVSGTTGSPISSTGNPYDTVFGDTSRGNDYGFKPPKPVSEMSVQEAIDYGKSTMIPATKGKIGKFDKDGNPLGTSAVGAYQFVSSTLPGLAEQTFGKDWKSVPMTPENQDLMAQKLFEQNKDKNLQDTWEGLPDTRPGAYANMTWPQVKAEIFKHEVGTTLTDEEIRLGSRNPGRTLTENLSSAASASDRAIGTITAEYVESLGNRNFPNDAAKLLAEKIGPGADQGRLVSEINNLINKSVGEDNKPRINAAQAAAIIELSLKGDADGFWNNFLWQGDALEAITGSEVGGGKTLDRGFAEAQIGDVASGAAASRVRTDFDEQQVRAVIVGLEAQRDQLQARYQQAARAAQIRPGIAPQLPRLKAEYEAALREVALARKAAGLEDLPITPPTPAQPVSMSGRITGR